MEKINPMEAQEGKIRSGLFLTESLLLRLKQLARIGIPTAILCFLLSALAAGYIAYNIYVTASQFTEAFYLLEGDNAVTLITTVLQIIFVYIFIRATSNGYSAFKLLRNGEEDQALLEGTQKLGKMFRWFALLAWLYFATSAIMWFLTH